MKEPHADYLAVRERHRWSDDIRDITAGYERLVADAYDAAGSLVFALLPSGVRVEMRIRVDMRKELRVTYPARVAEADERKWELKLRRFVDQLGRRPWVRIGGGESAEGRTVALFIEDLGFGAGERRVRCMWEEESCDEWIEPTFAHSVHLCPQHALEAGRREQLQRAARATAGVG